MKNRLIAFVIATILCPIFALYAARLFFVVWFSSTLWGYTEYRKKLDLKDRMRYP